MYVAAEIAGTSVGADKLSKGINGVWKLKIQNSAGYELPNTGGAGTNLLYLAGLLLTALAGTGFMIKSRRRRAA